MEIASDAYLDEICVPATASVGTGTEVALFVPDEVVDLLAGDDGSFDSDDDWLAAEDVSLDVDCVVDGVSEFVAEVVEVLAAGFEVADVEDFMFTYAISGSQPEPASGF